MFHQYKRGSMFQKFEILNPFYFSQKTPTEGGDFVQKI